MEGSALSRSRERLPREPPAANSPGRARGSKREGPRWGKGRGRARAGVGERPGEASGVGGSGATCEEERKPLPILAGSPSAPPRPTLSRSSGWVQQAAPHEARPPKYQRDTRFSAIAPPLSLSLLCPGEPRSSPACSPPTPSPGQALNRQRQPRGGGSRRGGTPQGQAGDRLQRATVARERGTSLEGGLKPPPPRAAAPPRRPPPPGMAAGRMQSPLLFPSSAHG